MRKIKKHQNYSFVKNHFQIYYKVYLIYFYIFIIGIIIGVLLVNNMTESRREELSTHINSSINSLKDNYNEISTNNILKKSLLKNTIIIFIIWILGLNYFSKYFLSIILFIFGTEFGYIVSCIITSLQIKKAILFIISTLFLHNLIFIPVLIFLIVQGIIGDNYYNIYSNKKNINIRFSFMCIISFILLINSSFVETYAATVFLKSIIKYL